MMSGMGKLAGQIALVTGASRGIGKGSLKPLCPYALQLGSAGATVYVTGRKPKEGAAQPSALEKTAAEISARGGHGVAVFCDHSDEADIQGLFRRIGEENNGRLDILVNNAYSAVNADPIQLLMDSAGKKFYQLEPSVWDDVNVVGLKNHYICSVYAARMMVPAKSGLIVTVSSPGGLTYLFNIAYGVGKAGCDRLAADMGAELRSAKVTSVSLWPGPVKTETVQARILNADNSQPKLGSEEMFAKGESIEYAGKAVVHFAADPKRHGRTGRILLTSDLGTEYGFTDENGETPENLRSVSAALERARWRRLAALVPGWVKLPGWAITAAVSKL